MTDEQAILELETAAFPKSEARNLGADALRARAANEKAGSKSFEEWWNGPVVDGERLDYKTTYLAGRASRDREIAGLLQALRDCRDDMIHWANYADDYFREKHNFAGDVAKYDEIIATLEARLRENGDDGFNKDL